MQISDKWKAVVAAVLGFATAFAGAAEDSTVTFQEAGVLAAAAFGIGLAVWATRNKAPA